MDKKTGRVLGFLFREMGQVMCDIVLILLIAVTKQQAECNFQLSCSSKVQPYHCDKSF